MRVLAPSSQVFTARLFHALADETRLRILHELSAGELCVCDLMESLDAAQSRLSFHLKTLKEAGLVRDRRDGRWVYYALNHGPLAGLIASLDTLANRPPPGRRTASSCR